MTRLVWFMSESDEGCRLAFHVNVTKLYANTFCKR